MCECVWVGVSVCLCVCVRVYLVVILTLCLLQCCHCLSNAVVWLDESAHNCVDIKHTSRHGTTHSRSTPSCWLAGMCSLALL